MNRDEHCSFLKINLRERSFLNCLPFTDPMPLTERAAQGGDLWLEHTDGQKAETDLQQRRVSMEPQFAYPLMPVNA